MMLVSASNKHMHRAMATGAIAALASLGTSAQAQISGGSCSSAYHAALSELNTTKGASVANAVTAMRAADAMLPGRWIYSQALLGKPAKKQRAPEDLRPCLEPFKFAGRIRCRKFGEAPPQADPQQPTELDIAPPPSPAELRVLKAVADLVDARGGVPDIGNNGRYRWLAERATSDIKTYIAQPPHEAICSGANEVTEFYAAQLKPLQKRAADVGELVVKARALAAERYVGLMADIGRQSAAAEPGASNAISLVQLTADAVRPVLDEGDVAAVLGETTALAALQRAKPALIKAQVAAAGGDALVRDHVLAAGRVVRMIEAAAYAEIYAQRYAAFNSAVITMPQEIQVAHKRVCTCGK